MNSEHYSPLNVELSYPRWPTVLNAVEKKNKWNYRDRQCAICSISAFFREVFWPLTYISSNSGSGAYSLHNHCYFSNGSVRTLATDKSDSQIQKTVMLKKETYTGKHLLSQREKLFVWWYMILYDIMKLFFLVYSLCAPDLSWWQTCVGLFHSTHMFFLFLL